MTQYCVRWTDIHGGRHCTEPLSEQAADILKHRLEAQYHFEDIKKVEI
jgi:hypothetical protein